MVKIVRINYALWFAVLTPVMSLLHLLVDHFIFIYLVSFVLGDVHDQDVQVFVILVYQLLKVLRLVMRAHDVEEPLHGADDPRPEHLLHFVLVDTAKVRDRIL